MINFKTQLGAGNPVEPLRLVRRQRIYELILAGRTFRRVPQVQPLAEWQHQIGRGPHRKACARSVGEAKAQTGIQGPRCV